MVTEMKSLAQVDMNDVELCSPPNPPLHGIDKRFSG